MSRAHRVWLVLPWWCTVTEATVVNLVLEPPANPVTVDSPFLVEIWLETATGQDQTIAGVRTLLQWNPSDFTLVGVHNNGPHAWLLSRFPDDSALDGINNTWDDGDAKYEALASLGNPAIATSDGLLVASLEFRAQRPVIGSPIDVPAALGQWSTSRVFGGDEPNQDVTGALVGAIVTAIPSPQSGLMLGAATLLLGCQGRRSDDR